MFFSNNIQQFNNGQQETKSVSNEKTTGRKLWDFAVRQRIKNFENIKDDKQVTATNGENNNGNIVTNNTKLGLRPVKSNSNLQKMDSAAIKTIPEEEDNETQNRIASEPVSVPKKIPQKTSVPPATQELGTSPIQIMLPECKILNVVPNNYNLDNTNCGDIFGNDHDSIFPKLIKSGRRVSISLEYSFDINPDQLTMTSKYIDETDIPPKVSKLIGKYESIKKNAAIEQTLPKNRYLRSMSKTDGQAQTVEFSQNDQATSTDIVDAAKPKIEEVQEETKDLLEEQANSDRANSLVYHDTIRKIKALRKEAESEQERILLYRGNGEDEEYRDIKKQLMAHMVKLDDMQHEDYRIMTVARQTFEFCHCCLEELITKVKNNQL